MKYRVICLALICLPLMTQLQAQSEAQPSLGQSLDGSKQLPATKRLAVIGGEFCLSALLGRQTNTWWNGDLNTRVSGDLKLDLWGLPVEVSAFGSSVVPLQGRQSYVRIRVDTDRLRSLDQAKHQKKLGELDRQLDSLKALREEMNRVQLGRERYRAMNTGVQTDTTLLQAPTFDPVTMPSLPALAESRTPSLQFDTILSQPPAAAVRDQLQMDSMLHAYTGPITNGLPTIETQIRELEEQHVRLVSLGQLTGPSSFNTRHALNLRKLEVGDCTPNPSAFLINGLSFNGVSTLVGGERWSVGIDHGRSMDDAWRQDRSDLDRSQNLQRLFLFESLPNENLKRLTSITTKGAFGQGWWVGLGALYASKLDLPPGLDPLEQSTNSSLKNNVVELSIDKTFDTDHRLAVSFAKSAEIRSSTNEGPNDQEDAWSQLAAYRSSNWAMHMDWSSSLPSKRLRMTCATNLIGQGFNSLGLAFFRPGSRSGSIGVDKWFGRSLRVALNAMREQRNTPNFGTMDIERLRSLLSWRVTRSLRARLTFIPQRTLVTTAEGNTNPGSHRMLSLGGDGDLKLGKASLKIDAEVVTYQTAMSNGKTFTRAFRAGVTLARRNGDHYSLRCNTTDPGDSTRTADLSASASFSLVGGVGMEVTGTLPLMNATWASWTVSMQKRLSEHWSIGLIIARVGRPDIFFNDSVLINEKSSYTCDGRVCYTW